MIGAHIPFFIYFTGVFSQSTNTTTIIKANKSNELIGDACYLSALMKRANDTDSTNNDKTPPPTIETSGNFYILSKSNFALYFSVAQEFNFKEYMISIKETFLDIDVPPPKILS